MTIIKEFLRTKKNDACEKISADADNEVGYFFKWPQIPCFFLPIIFCTTPFIHPSPVIIAAPSVPVPFCISSCDLLI